MIETVVVLLLVLNGNIIEHTYKSSMADCLKSRRIAQREVNPESVIFTCKKLKVKTNKKKTRKEKEEEKGDQ